MPLVSPLLFCSIPTTPFFNAGRTGDGRRQELTTSTDLLDKPTLILKFEKQVQLIQVKCTAIATVSREVLQKIKQQAKQGTCLPHRLYFC